MAKVVLVWNEHPTEVVAGFHARKVAKILRERYGHKVVVEKIPVSETNYGIVRRNTAEEALRRLIALDDSHEVARAVKAKHGAITFNFHASTPRVMGRAAKVKPQNFKTGEFGLSQPSFPTEIAFQRDPRRDYFVVEVPGHKAPLPKNLQKKHRQETKKIIQFLRTGAHGFTRSIRAEMALKPGYHLRYMPLKHPAQQKYLHPAISEKIAAAIHERITRKR